METSDLLNCFIIFDNFSLVGIKGDDCNDCKDEQSYIPEKKILLTNNLTTLLLNHFHITIFICQQKTSNFIHHIHACFFKFFMHVQISNFFYQEIKTI